MEVSVLDRTHRSFRFASEGEMRVEDAQRHKPFSGSHWTGHPLLFSAEKHSTTEYTTLLLAELSVPR
jgi:hypothetical protein